MITNNRTGADPDCQAADYSTIFSFLHKHSPVPRLSGFTKRKERDL